MDVRGRREVEDLLIVKWKESSTTKLKIRN